MRRSLIFLLITLLFLFSATATTPPKYVGKASCYKCHSYEQRTAAGTPHDGDKGCEGCHGPGEQHLKSGNGGSIFSFMKATPDEIRARCGECHREPIMSRHATGDVSCTSCHSSHHYVRKKYLLKADDDLLHNPA